jgi:hypothetical protein
MLTPDTWWPGYPESAGHALGDWPPGPSPAPCLRGIRFTYRVSPPDVLLTHTGRASCVAVRPGRPLCSGDVDNTSGMSHRT